VLKAIKEADVDEYVKALREIKEWILAKKQSESASAKQLFR